MKHKAFGFSLVYLLLFFASPILAQFGPLPPDEKSHWTMHNAREIILLLLADPASIRDLIPMVCPRERRLKGPPTTLAYRHTSRSIPSKEPTSSPFSRS